MTEWSGALGAAVGSYRRNLGLLLGNTRKRGGWVERLMWIMNECGRARSPANFFVSKPGEKLDPERILGATHPLKSTAFSVSIHIPKAEPDLLDRYAALRRPPDVCDASSK